MARRGLDLVLAVVLVVPRIGNRLRELVQSRVVCAFLAYEDASERSIGCVLHPARSNGRDRRSAAFRWIPGLACGAADYLCPGARRYQETSDDDRRRFTRATGSLDWYEYSCLIGSNAFPFDAADAAKRETTNAGHLLQDS